MKKSVGTFGMVFNDNITLLTYKNTDLEQKLQLWNERQH